MWCVVAGLLLCQSIRLSESSRSNNVVLCHCHTAEKHAKVPCVTVSVDDITFETTVR